MGLRGKGGGGEQWPGVKVRFVRIASGADDSVAAKAVRLALFPFSLCYGVGASFRGAFYRAGLLKRVTARRPVISVGNITTGGTGKTPMTLYLARFLTGKGFRVAVLARGYGGAVAEGLNDEMLQLKNALPGVTFFCDRDRAAAAEVAAADVLLLDDGFQHERLRRDLDVVTVDAICPFGGGMLLPAGLLREPVWALRRADVIVLTRSDQVAEGSLKETMRKLKELAPGALVVRAIHKPVKVFFPEEGREEEVAVLQGKKVAAFCGIGNPESFRRTLMELCGEMVLFRVFPDHHRYEAKELAEVGQEAKERGAEMIVTTEKDCVRLRGARGSILPLGVIEVELVITSGEDKLQEKVIEAVRVSDKG